MDSSPGTPDAVDALIAVLDEHSTRESLWATINKFGPLVQGKPGVASQGIIDAREGSAKADDSADLLGGGLAFNMGHLSGPISQKLFSAKVMPRLGAYPPVTLRELADAAGSHLAGYRDRQEFDYGYRRFLAEVRKKTRVRRESPQWEFLAAPFFAPLVFTQPITLSVSRGFALRLDILSRTVDEFATKTHTLVGVVSANSTAAAFEDIQSRVLDTVTCVVRNLLQDDAVFDAALNERICQHPYLDKQDAEKVIEQGYPAYTQALQRVELCLKLFFEHDPAIARGDQDKPYNPGRIHNAVRIATEADRQSEYSVALSLYVTALEALLGQKEEGISDKLGRRIATLLVCRGDDRRAAVEAFKSLYNLRSRALHGESLTTLPKAAWKARHLVSSVFTAVLDWLLWSTRADVGTTAKESLFSQLEDAQLSGKRLVGAPDYLAGSILPDEGA